MDSLAKIYIERAENELLLAKINLDISNKEELKGIFGITKDKTFFNNVISSAYYGIFYAAKAYLKNKGIITKMPDEHRKTYDEFEKFVSSGKLDKELLYIYSIESEKADSLLSIFFQEKRKRGRFTYNVKSSANLPFAQESLRNSRKFISAIKSLL